MGEAAVCVYCRERLVDERFRPFCCERCRLLDLAAWADGRYRIPGPVASVPDDPAPPAPDDEH